MAEPTQVPTPGSTPPTPNAETPSGTPPPAAATPPPPPTPTPSLGKKKWTKWFKTWGEILSYWVTVLGVLGALVAYVQWKISRGDHAVEIVLKLDEKFNSPEVEVGRNLIDWDSEYDEIRERLELLSNDDALKADNYQRRRMLLEPGSLERTNWIEERKKLDDKVKQLDSMLQFYETLNAARLEQQAPASWLSLRYCDWLDYYYDEDRKEFKDYVDHYYDHLSKWLNEDKNESDENRFFNSHKARNTSRPVVAILYPRPNQSVTESNVITATGDATTGKGAIGEADPSNRVARVYCQLNANEPIQAAGTEHWRTDNLKLSETNNVNVLRVYAVDGLNKTSVVQEIRFTYKRH